MIFIAYFTIDTPYKQEADELIATLKKFNLQYKVYGIPNQGSWQKNTQHKPKVLKKALEDHTESIVYVDADARIQANPVLLETLEDFDLGVHFKDNIELLSGTIFINNNNIMKQIVDEWIVECVSSPQIWDQRCLAVVIKRHPELKIYKLPAAYCQIFDSMAHNGAPVIEHFQASRRHKMEVRRGK